MTHTPEPKTQGLPEKIAERIADEMPWSFCADFNSEQAAALIRSELLGSELVKALEYVFEIADRHQYSFGEYESFFDEGNQIQEWCCFGCDGEGVSKWPAWKLEFKHAENCRYLKARAAMNELRNEGKNA